MKKEKKPSNIRTNWFKQGKLAWLVSALLLIALLASILGI
jgi:hypothetical protein